MHRIALLQVHDYPRIIWQMYVAGNKDI